MVTTINKQTAHTTRFLSLRMRRKTRLRYGLRPPASASEVDPAVEGCFFADILLFFDGCFWVEGSGTCCVVEKSIGAWELVSVGRLTPDRDRRLGMEVVVVVCVVFMMGASTSVMVTTKPKERESK